MLKSRQRNYGNRRIRIWEEFGGFKGSVKLMADEIDWYANHSLLPSTLHSFGRENKCLGREEVGCVLAISKVCIYARSFVLVGVSMLC